MESVGVLGSEANHLAKATLLNGKSTAHPWSLSAAGMVVREHMPCVGYKYIASVMATFGSAVSVLSLWQGHEKRIEFDWIFHLNIPVSIIEILNT